MTERVYILDTTLRDGEQAPGISLMPDEKLLISQWLDQIGVDIIEAGFPTASEADFEAVKNIASHINNAEVCGLARSINNDIDRCWEALKEAHKPRIHLFIGTSPFQRNILNASKEDIIKKVRQAIQHAKKRFRHVQWSAMDATRTEPDFLYQLVAAAIESGATTIGIPDTVGHALPQEMSHYVHRLMKLISSNDHVILSTHCHNDLGLATANSLAAIASGARQVECTVNGIGERAGNAALEEVVMAMCVKKDLISVHSNIDATQLKQISNHVSSLTQIPVPWNKPIVGKHVFTHKSGIHQDGVLKDPNSFEIIDPTSVGHQHSLIKLGRHSGRAALMSKLHEWGYKIDKDTLDKLFFAFKSYLSHTKEIQKEDIISLLNTIKEDNSII